MRREPEALWPYLLAIFAAFLTSLAVLTAPDNNPELKARVLVIFEGLPEEQVLARDPEYPRPLTQWQAMEETSPTLRLVRELIRKDTS